MASETAGASTQQGDITRRAQRANRILDAAAALVLRWGYNKTTIDDVARQAGVAKGTIYLHWKTREELFTALLMREGLALGEDFQRRLAADPAGATLRGIYKNTALALLKRPLLKALVLRDADVLGKLAHDQHGTAISREKMAGFTVYLGFLRDRQLVRSDLSLRQQVYVVNAIFTGFLLAAPLLPEEYALSDEEIADLIGEAVHRTLESGRVVPPEELATLSDALSQYVSRLMAMGQEQLQHDEEA